MKKEIFSNLLNRLVEIEPNNSPLISCFVNLEHPRSNYAKPFEDQFETMRKRMSGDRKIDFEDAVDEIRDYLENKIRPGSRGAAIFARWGDHPVFLPLQFEVPVSNSFIVDELPHIYPLIELKDTYHRFVIAIATENEARILETTIGSVTEDIMKKRPEYRSRLGREWTREHYHNHRKERASRFVKEKVEVIESLMDKGGHSHLVLAGSPKMVARLKKALPARLADQVIDTLNINPKHGISPILSEAMHLFVALENVESHDKARELESAVLSNNLGVCGFDASYHALEEGYASILIIDQHSGEIELREELVRLATKRGIPIETVRGNSRMEQLGGVGCLLRFRPEGVTADRLLLEAA